MSAHSFPSLTSDSSSIPSGSSDLHDARGNDPANPAVSSPSTSPKPFSVQDDPDTALEIVQLRKRVSKLEQDKFVLGDYAAELQSRIRQLERERMEHTNTINHPDPSEKHIHSTSVFHPLSRSTTPKVHPGSPAHHRASSSLSAATSATAKRGLPYVSSLSKPSSPTPSQLAFPTSSTHKSRLVPKRSPRLVPPEESIHSSVAEPRSLYESPHKNLTPTRRRLQAMCGRLSLDSTPHSPSANGGGPSNHDANDHEPCSPHDAHHTRIYNSIPSRRENGRHDPESTRTAFTSKLDSIILTSKLFPLSSSRSKAPLESIPTARLSQNDHTPVIPLAHAFPSSPPHSDNVFLDSPPKRNVKVRAPRKGNKSLSRSLGLEENHNPDLHPKTDERKSRPQGRVSFSDRPFSEKGDESEIDTDPPGRMWGSWGRKKQPARPLTSIKEKQSPPPSAFSSRFARSRGEGGGEPEEKRCDRPRSIAAGCLRFVSGSSDRDKSYTGGRRESRVLRRSHSESRKSTSHSHSHSPARERPRPDTVNNIPKHLILKDKDEKQRITPSRVGSPMPKGRASDLQRGSEELERTSSLRSAGKWGQRGRAFTHEFTRRRTIHPMFSFERPGSAGASTSSSRRADDEETPDEHRASNARGRVIEKPRRSRREVRPSEFGVSSSHDHTPHVQDDSAASGHTAPTLARSESVSTHKGKGSMMRTRLGVQTHGTFAFEPAAAVVIPPRSAPPNGGFPRGVEAPGGIARAADRHAKAKSEPGQRQGNDMRDRVYLDFCNDLKVVLGDGEEWASFTKYIHRFDIEVLTADVLLRRVKRLIDGSPFVDQNTKLKLYERFVSIVQDNVE